jgi:hypothetical protein
MTKHTPGPWHVSNETGKPPIVYAADGYAVGNATVFHRKHGGIDTSDANARLMAAAPDLLAELKQAAVELEEAANVLEPSLPALASIYRVAADKKRAAIAKAEGK